MTAIITHEAVREAALDAGRALGLPEPVTEAYVRLLRPCLHLCPYDKLPEELRKEDARPAARAAGPARLPKGVEVPGYVPHVLTVDCAALPTGVLDIAFPADGHVAVLAEITDQDHGWVFHVPAGTETVERPPAERDPLASVAPFPLYAVPGITTPKYVDSAEIPEAAAYIDGNAERAELLDELFEKLESLVSAPWSYEIQLGGWSPAWHDPLEDRGDILLVAIPEDAVSDGDCITYVSGTPEEIAEYRYAELAFSVEV
ncbi:hypothetical protein B9W68_12715 [Streptomyces sp. CS227]|uniref:hypothetical protein n=1 Tax=Streptomyces sp. CS227 TaxID=1982763 RepID=UPI000B40F9CA|nr:hypothetical protein [Streptomyces sp. CS227]OWA13019.1 hypothetical protein B9W68_12715 [Streptomyces sp. CS227]